MLTNKQIANIRNFDNLTSNHRRVFRYMLRKKCEKTINHLIFVLANYEKLHLRPEDIVNLQNLEELIKILTKIKEKQHYKIIKS